MHFASECHFQLDQYSGEYSVFLPTLSHLNRYDATYEDSASDIHILKLLSISKPISLQNN